MRSSATAYAETFGLLIRDYECDSERVRTEDEDRALDGITARLSALFPQLPAHRVADVVRAVHREFDGRPIRDFVPVLVERSAREQLTNGVREAAAVVG